MGDLFLKLLNMSLAASWLIVAVILFRLIARKTPRWMICLLWGLVAIRLICPFSMNSSFSIVPSDEVITKSSLSESHRKLNFTAGVEPVDAMIDEYLGDTSHDGTSVAYDDGNILMSGLGVIWICGVFGLLLYAVIMNLRLRRYLKETVLLRKNIYFCDYVRAPFVYGLLRPNIYLPSGIDESDMEYVIAHEKAHLQRKDHIWKVVAFLILAIYWFHPLSWAAFILFCRDIELACDEKVIKNLTMTEKKAYSESLLSCSFKKRIALVYPLAFGEVGVKQRVKAILRYRKPAFAVILISFLAIILIGICFFTTKPQGDQNTGMPPRDLSPAQIEKGKKEIELKQMLLDYDKDHIVEVSVFLQEDDDAITAADILVVSKEKIMNAEEQDKIQALASEYLKLDVHNINLECVDSEKFFQEDIILRDADEDLTIDKNSLYSDYIGDTMASKIKDAYGFLDCKVEVHYSEDEIVSADVYVVKNDEKDVAETDILDYVSESLGISAQDVSLSLN
ncbi:MAG: hypothetical protein IJ567_04905 [Lachnospiraceae bacterium]|nr:hypothetical protein [Lachnospiraceae bacterium]